MVINKGTAEIMYKNRFPLENSEFLISTVTADGVEILHFERKTNIVPQVKRKAIVNKKGELFLLTDGIFHRADIDLS